MKFRGNGYLKQGVLRYRIYKHGKQYGTLTLPGLLHWINENEKPASRLRAQKRAGNNAKVISINFSVSDRSTGDNRGGEDI